MKLPYRFSKNRVSLAGNPSAATALIFVHGFGCNQSAWSDIVADFAADFRIVLYDTLGAEGDDLLGDPDRPASYEAYAEELVALCAALDIRQAIAVGHSAGAMVCALAALREPARFSRLVMIGASPRYLDAEGYVGGFTPVQVDAMYRMAAMNLSKWATTFATVMMDAAGKPRLSVDFAESLRLLPAGRVLTTLSMIFQSDYRAAVGKLTVPTLIVQTANDPAVPLVVALFLRETIRNSRLAIIDAEGHLPHVSAPATVISAMREFLGDRG